MTDLCRLIFWTLVDLMRARATLEAEIWVLRQQINVLRRAAGEFSSTPTIQCFGSLRNFCRAFGGSHCRESCLRKSLDKIAALLQSRHRTDAKAFKQPKILFGHSRRSPWVCYAAGNWTISKGDEHADRLLAVESFVGATAAFRQKIVVLVSSRAAAIQSRRCIRADPYILASFISTKIVAGSGSLAGDGDRGVRSTITNEKLDTLTATPLRRAISVTLTPGASVSSTRRPDTRE